ncbi:hypothetical protein NFI96_014123 [Prochilodus magdalenae]|nr:hypothetical protein NFI96_014123 [Prochilodus magdalenae]
MLERTRQGHGRQIKMPGKCKSKKKHGILSMQRLFCCSCLPTGEKDSCLRSEHNEENDSTGGDGENVHIVVEDLGLDNPNFTLPEMEDYVHAQRTVMGRSASSVSSCQRAVQKRKLAPLSSMPLQSSTTQNNLNSDEYDFAVDSLFSRTGSVSVSASEGGLLTPPVINLIPPTPSDVIDDDQFFDTNSEEESVTHTSGSEGMDSMGSVAPGEQESEEEDEKTNQGVAPDEMNPEVKAKHECADVDLKETTIEAKEEKNKMNFLRSYYQVPPLPEYPRKRSFNAGINLLQFTEHNLDDLNNKDSANHDLLKAKLRLLPFSNNMDSIHHQKKPVVRSYSLGEKVARSHTFPFIHHSVADISDDEGSPRQRRITVASYIPQPKDQNGNVAAQDSSKHQAKALAELNTEEVCQWFSSIGLEKCLPFIKEAELSGSHIACIDLNTLDVLQVSGVEEREKLLSAIYKELHPPNTTTQKLDSILETFGPNNVEEFTAALVSMTKSKSSPQINCVTMNQSSHKFRYKSTHSAQRAKLCSSSQLSPCGDNNYCSEALLKQKVISVVLAFERIVHLRTPKDTSVGKVMESCLRMLGIKEDKGDFNLKIKKGSSEEFSVDQQIGNLLGSETRLLELELCKKSWFEIVISGTYLFQQFLNQQGIDGKIQELNQQVDYLQNVILQVQELHQGLVAFCSELKNMDRQQDIEKLDSLELKRRLGQTQDKLQEKRQSLQILRDSLSTAPVQTSKRTEVWLLDKMRLNCQVFQDEIALMHLSRHMGHLQRALEEVEAKERVTKKNSTLAQLVSPECPTMLVAIEERAGPDGCYSFTVHWMEGHGLQVVHAGNSNLRLNDRLVEVNGVSVVGSSEEELVAILQGPVSQLVILRKPDLQHSPLDCTQNLQCSPTTAMNKPDGSMPQ